MLSCTIVQSIGNKFDCPAKFTKKEVDILMTSETI